jgi:hypothetical protein
MRRTLILLSIMFLAGGCAATAPATRGLATTGSPAQELTAYTGEVWLWDEGESIVTLRQPAGNVRVRVTRADLARLRLHEVTTVRGVLAPPVEIEQVEVTTEAVPTTVVDHAAATATVRTVAADGMMAVDSDHGPLTVLIATPVARHYGSGVRVRVETAVQAMKLVPRGSMTQPDVLPVSNGEPGDSSVVTGPVLSIEPSGRMRIGSPQGPIALWLPNAHRFSVGEFVRVRTFVAVTQ